MNGLQFSFKSQKLNSARVACQDHSAREFGRSLGNHCVASCEVAKNGFALATMVLDYYTPAGMPAGWYVAFRMPGKNKGLKPFFRVFMGETLTKVVIAQSFDCAEFARVWARYSDLIGF